MPLERRPPATPPPPEAIATILGTVSLTLDDVQDVMDHLSRANLKPVLSAGAATASEAADLKSATKHELRRITIGLEERPFRVRLWRDRADIVIAADDRVSVKVASEISAMLRERRVSRPLVVLRVGAIIFGALVALFSAMFVVLIGLGSIDLSEPGTFRYEPLLVVLLPVVVMTWMLATTEFSRGRATVKTYFRRERRQVSVPLAQTVWIAVITAAVSGAVGAAVTWVLSRPGS